jgi:peptide deformylase
MNIVTDLNELRKECTEFDSKLDEFECDILTNLATFLMFEMKEHNGQGLAAPQIGISRKAFIMKLENGRQPIFIANPTIIKIKGTQDKEEGCLSLPGIIVKVKRSFEIKVKGLNQYCNPVNYTFTGIESRRAQHEIDHLNGKLIIDYLK